MSTPELLDTGALRRRVLLAALLTLLAFVAIGMTIVSTGMPSWLLVPAMVLVYALVVRPVMAPVRAAVRLRRALAYQAFLEGRETDRQRDSG